MKMITRNIYEYFTLKKNVNIKKDTSLIFLWKRFIPLSMSDFCMTLGDTLRTLALSYLPFSELSLSSVGIAKSVVVFFESPIIMVLHASTFLAPVRVSRKVLFKLVAIISFLLSSSLLLLSIDPVYSSFYDFFFHTSSIVKADTQVACYFLILWPATIAWRRFFQGILISIKEEKFMVYAATVRLLSTALILCFGVIFGANPIYLASYSLIFPVLLETIVVLAFYYKKREKIVEKESSESMPSTLWDVFKYYLPLAMTMICFWGGRAMITSYVSLDNRADLEVACWTAALSFVIPISNATRMLQQVLLSSNNLSFREILKFTMSIGVVFGFILFVLGFTSVGQKSLFYLLGKNDEIYQQILPLIKIFSLFPLFTALQNMFQAILIFNKKNKKINFACIAGIAASLILMKTLLSAGVSGALAATYSTLLGIFIEMTILSLSAYSFKDNKFIFYLRRS